LVRGVCIEHNIDKKLKYSFKRYSKIYAMLFTRERNRLMKRLGKPVRIEHIGSTAVPGLGGKNILDIMVDWSPRGLQRRKNQLERLGYAFHSEDGSRDRLFFVRDTKYIGRNIRIHLHLTNLNSKDWTEALAFRNYLRYDKKAMLEYAAVKRKAASIANGDKSQYLKIKGPFINAAIRKLRTGKHA
jgi:GrpB-like predicted nucleotidyltransferase (UPF0157 family)